MALREETKELTYSDYSKNLFIYRGLDGMNRPICQKIQYITQNSSFLSALEVQQRLHHRSIVPVLSARTEESESGTVAIGEFPWAGESLEREVLRRAKDEQQWSEDECILLLDNIVDALAYAQSQGVPHGAVSPSRIFLSETLPFCISGFLGHTVVDKPQSLAKLPIFLSPLGRRVYANKLMGLNGSDIKQDIYKSDVYSLGLTFLYLFYPIAEQHFGSTEKLTELASQLQLPQGLKSLLASMLHPEESLRPDSLQLRKSLQEVVKSTVLSRTHSQLGNSDFAGLKKSLKMLMRSSWNVIADVQPLQLRVFSASRTLSPQRARSCKACNRDYSLRNDEKWRLSLLGSSQAAASKCYCSENCWKTSTQALSRTGATVYIDISPAGTASAPLPAETPVTSGYVSLSAKFRFDMGSMVVAQTSVIEYRDCGERYYYDCQVHQCDFRKVHEYFNKTTPTLHGRCPQCQPMITILTYEESLFSCPEFEGKIFFTISKIGSLVRRFGRTAAVAYTGHYCMPVSVSLVAEITNGKCHFCGARAADDWRCFFHSGKPHFICSMRCARAHFDDDADQADYVICPACKEPTGIASLENALSSRKGYASMVGCFVHGCCGICVFAASDIDLPCAHSFCKECMKRLLIKRDGDDFPCLFCGVATPISYLQGLA